MTLIVNDLRNLNSLLPARLVAGAAGLSNPVENISLADSRVNTQHLPVHEVLVMSLNGLYQSTGNSFLAFTNVLKAQQCSALLVRNNDRFADLPEALVTSCEQQALPLFVLPYDTNDRDVFVDVTQELFTEKKTQLNYYKQIDRHFASLTQSNSRQSLIDTLAVLIDNPVVLLQVRDTQAQVLLQSPNLTTELPTLAWSQRKPLDQQPDDKFPYTWLPVGAADWRLVTVPLFRPATATLYLGVIEESRPLQAADFPTIESAINFLQLIISQQSASQQNRQAYTNDLIDDLLAGNLTPSERYQSTLQQLNLSDRQPYRAIIIQALTDDQHLVTDYFNQQPALTRQLVHLLRSHWTTLSYRIRPDRMVLICPEQDSLINELKSVLPQLPVRSDCHYQAGVGTPRLPRQLQASAEEALKTVQLLIALTDETPVRSFNELGFYRCLPALNQPQELRSLVPEELLQLQKLHQDLYQTLATYVQHNLSVKNSAAALFIHPKTMSYRLGKIKQFIHTDFDDAEDLFTLNVGLHILRLLQQPPVASTLV